MTAPRRVLLEVAIETPEDGFAATQGGADRLELCSALDLGGLTPSRGALHELALFSKLPVCVMIRPRPGDFVYSPTELEMIRRDIENFLPDQPAGFVFGALLPDGRINLEACLKLVKAANGIPCVFHRAFDRTPDLLEALHELTAMGFQRVLTSGQAETAIQGAKLLAELVQKAERNIEILACGTIRSHNVAELIRLTGCKQVHGAFSEPAPERTERGYRGYPNQNRTSEESVRATRAILDRPWDLIAR